MMHAAKDSIDLGSMCGDIHASLHFYHDLLRLPKVGVSEATTGTMHRLRFGFRYLTFVVTNVDDRVCGHAGLRHSREGKAWRSIRISTLPARRSS